MYIQRNFVFYKKNHVILSTYLKFYFEVYIITKIIEGTIYENTKDESVRSGFCS